MDGCCRVLASPVPVAYGLDTLLVRPLTLYDLGTLEHLLLLARPSPAERLLALAEFFGVHEGHRLADRVRELAEASLAEVEEDRGRRVIRADHLHIWLGTPDGLEASAWLCLTRWDGNPCIPSIPAANAFLEAGGAGFRDLFRRARDMASGLDLLSILDWQRPARAEAPLKFHPWKRVARNLAEAYGWGPEQMARLTLWNLAVYTCREEALGQGVVEMSPADALAFAGEGRQARRTLERAFREG